MPDSHDDGRVPLRQRSIPDQLDHFGNKLGGLLDRANLDRDMLIVIGAAVVNLGAIAAQLRKQGEQLAAATARAEKAERQFNLVRSLNRLAKANAVELHAQLDAARARIAELGEPEVERRIIGVSGRVYTPTEFDLPHRADWVPGVRLEERQVYPTPWRVAPDAAQDGLSEPVERSETSGGAFHGNTSATASAGLSEPEPPRDTSAWCWAPNPNGPLRCGRLRDHEPPHRRGERTWTDDDTTGADR